MQFKQAALVGTVIAAVAAPGASARVAVDRPAERAAANAVDPSRFAEMAAHREAIANRHWEQAGRAPTLTLVRPVGDGFDWSSALIGASLPAALLVGGVLCAPALTRRRLDRHSALT